MSQSYHSGRTKTDILSPLETRRNGNRLLVSDPSVRTAINDLIAKVDELLEHLKEEHS